MTNTKKSIFGIMLGAFFIVSCSMETDNQPAEASDSSMAYIEFMACTAGPDFNGENMTKMISDWQKLITAESLYGAWGYVPDGDKNLFGETMWWELMWTSQEEANSVWAEWVENEAAATWTEEYSNVMVCDGEGRNAFDATFPINGDQFGEPNENGYFYSEFYHCNYNENGTMDDAVAFLPGYTEAVMASEYDGTGYSYGNYFALNNEDGSHTEEDIDFLWASFASSQESMETVNELFEKDVRASQFPKFSEFASCGDQPDVYHSWTFYLSENKDFMPSFPANN
tara:strand:+ start:2882 stop:3733 length:852 start_codon:yes stop_codon:yes gene_type:complete